MGTHKRGILGNFSGKVGTVIGSKWRGVWVMRGLSDSKRGKPNPTQLQQQAKFSMMMKFLQPLSSLVSQTYDNSPAEMSGMNKAFSDNIRNAITGVYPALAIAYRQCVRCGVQCRPEPLDFLPECRPKKCRHVQFRCNCIQRQSGPNLYWFSVRRWPKRFEQSLYGAGKRSVARHI